MSKVYNSPPNWPTPPAGWRPPPGWHPQPEWGPAPDGWNFYVDAPWEQDDPHPKRSRRGRFALVAVLLVAGVIGTVLVTGGKFGALEVGADRVRLEFDNSASGENPSETAVAQAQPELEQRIASIEEQVQQAPAPVQPSDADVAGVWQGDNGFTYVFEQYGANLVWREESAVYGVTAVGEGIVEGNDVYIEFLAYDGTVGYLELTYDSGTLTGSFTNALVAGAPITLS
jgi:hypothetical protein